MKCSAGATTRCARTGHWCLPEGGDPVTPAEVYVHRQPVRLPKSAGLGQGRAGEVECDYRRPALPVSSRARRGGAITSTNGAHRLIRGAGVPHHLPTAPPHQRCTAPLTRRGRVRPRWIQHLQKSDLGCVHFNFGAKTIPTLQSCRTEGPARMKSTHKLNPPRISQAGRHGICVCPTIVKSDLLM